MQGCSAGRCRVLSSPYLVISIEAKQGGRQLGVSVHNMVHLDIGREGADIVVLDAAQLQIKQSLQQQQGGAGQPLKAGQLKSTSWCLTSQHDNETAIVMSAGTC